MTTAFYTDLSLIENVELKSLLPHLSEERRLFAMQLKSKKRFAECVMAEALARYALAKCSTAGHLPGDFCFAQNEYGKPYQTTEEGLFFNVSHSSGFVLCAVSDGEVGADIERAGRMREKMAGNILGPLELGAYETAQDKKQYLVHIWCRKESFYKMLGVGIRSKLTETDSLKLEKDGKCRWTEGFVNSDMFFSICEKNINLPLDKSGEITQPLKLLNFVHPQDVVVEFKKI